MRISVNRDAPSPIAATRARLWARRRPLPVRHEHGRRILQRIHALQRRHVRERSHEAQSGCVRRQEGVVALPWCEVVDKRPEVTQRVEVEVLQVPR